MQTLYGLYRIMEQSIINKLRVAVNSNLCKHCMVSVSTSVVSDRFRRVCLIAAMTHWVCIFKSIYILLYGSQKFWKSTFKQRCFICFAHRRTSYRCLYYAYAHTYNPSYISIISKNCNMILPYFNLPYFDVSRKCILGKKYPCAILFIAL